MANVVVVGSQWGDEGKGKIVDWLSERADVVVRYQGGHNAGHTLVIGNTTYKLSLLPSGAVRPGKLSIIGNGVVVDPWALVAEIDAMAELGVTVTPETLRIAENAALILPSHGAIDNQGVAGIVAALKARHHVGPFRQPVDDLALALIAPLRTDDDHIGHFEPPSATLGSGQFDNFAILVEMRAIELAGCRLGRLRRFEPAHGTPAVGAQCGHLRRRGSTCRSAPIRRWPRGCASRAGSP